MRFLVVGGGSMGKRRIRCLLANGARQADLRMADLREDRRREAEDRYGVKGFKTVDEGMLWEPTAVICSLPPAFNIAAALASARSGTPFFFESPLAIGLDGIDELATLVERHEILAAPGSQLAFHPLYARLKEWVDDPSLGVPLVLHQEQGDFVPAGHPWEDYRNYYVSDEEMGGANLDMLAFEFTWHSWLLGDGIERLYSESASLSSLEIRGSDSHQIVDRRSNGSAFSFSIEAFNRPSYRASRVLSEAGSVEIDVTGGYVRRFSTTTSSGKRGRCPRGLTTNKPTSPRSTADFVASKGKSNGTCRWRRSAKAQLRIARSRFDPPRVAPCPITARNRPISS